MELDWFMVSVRICESWREGRRLLDRSLRPGATTSYQQMMQEKTRWFLNQLFADPKEFHHHIELSSSRLQCIEGLLTTRQLSGETYHVTHLWLRLERWRQFHDGAHSGH
jgi:hypothetical protein